MVAWNQRALGPFNTELRRIKFFKKTSLTQIFTQELSFLLVSRRLAKVLDAVLWVQGWGDLCGTSAKISEIDISGRLLFCLEYYEFNQNPIKIHEKHVEPRVNDLDVYL